MSAKPTVSRDFQTRIFFYERLLRKDEFTNINEVITYHSAVSLTPVSWGWPYLQQLSEIPKKYRCWPSEQTRG